MRAVHALDEMFNAILIRQLDVAGSQELVHGGAVFRDELAHELGLGWTECACKLPSIHSLDFCPGPGVWQASMGG